MTAGPIFSREALTAPRRLSHYLLRSGYVAFLLVLMYTIRQSTIGFQDLQFSGDIASYSLLVFQVFALLQLTVATFFSTLFTAANIAQEKDRRTLILLLMTDMRNHELALGKLFASLLVVVVLLATSVPVFAVLRLLGGVTWTQIFWAEAVISATTLAAGAWGGLIAFWRQKTFQTLAVSVLGIVIALAGVEAMVVVAGPQTPAGETLAVASPVRALLQIMSPLSAGHTLGGTNPAMLSVVFFLVVATAFALTTIVRMRIWNPSQAVRQFATQEEPAKDSQPAISTAVRHRSVWNNPVVWKEIVTRGYGRRVIWIKIAYVALVLAIAQIIGRGEQNTLILGMVSPAGFGFLAAVIISLLLVNAQAVTSVTTERDMNTLDILLATDLSAKEFMTGKIIGAAWNAKEMVLMPLLLLLWAAVRGHTPGLTAESVTYLVIGYLVLCLFSIMLGLHGGLTWDNSRSAIANSLGTMFFLFIGIFVFMLLLVEARSSFAIQMQSFIVFIGLGSLGLYGSMTHKNPSSALTMAALMLPFLTFYSITDFLLGGTLGVCLWVCVAYGFASIAMLVPAISDFDVALGRTTQDG